MPNMIDNDLKWTLSQEISDSGTIKKTLATRNTFLDKDIEIITTTPAAQFTTDGATVKATRSGFVRANVSAGTIPMGTLEVIGGELSAGNGIATLNSNGLSSGSSIDNTKKIELSDTNAAGYYELEATGSGTVHSAAVTSQVTSGGYMPEEDSPVTQKSPATQSSATEVKKMYVRQSTLSTNIITPTSAQQTVTIGKGYYHENRTITIEAADESTLTTVVPTTSLASVGMDAYFTAGTSSDKDVTLTPRFSTTSGYITAGSNVNNGGVEYYKIRETDVTEGVTTVNGTTVSRGSASWSSGWMTSGSITPASFTNIGATGVDYVDISNTSAAPVLVSGDYLYINKGYTDNLKISLAKLVPNDSDIKGHADYILTGHSAYDEDGTLISGSIAFYDGSYTAA